ncbi:MAG: DUF4892 domain-containing protein [Gammaproteobacteria bacterium]|jgi:hypothetical protein|nr:DUF4892 domain-containing protein [Gammaproteobacteria bacterium]MDP6535609.1 DUF4892 domain-containing protein [Gammaproteobacteria bacterium]MDP6731772.1 DUF4892 domain-containing protein [Gammaproteobacteria bacterium]HAJ77266.1 hypothetical protein [Gammaproteobacteria bacterium]
MNSIWPQNYKLVFILSLVWLVPGIASAQPAGVTTSYTDHPIFDRFPDSEITSVEFDEDVNYQLVLSGLQRTRGVVTPDDSVRLRGDVTKIVYEVSQEFTGEDVFQFFSEQIQEKNYTELFSCTGRGCGSSNYWANDIFRKRILYGPERNQYYLAMRADNGLENPPHIALYIITRSNRRIYAYLEIVEVGGAQIRIDVIEANDLLEILQAQGSVIVPNLSFVTDNTLSAESDLTPIADMLRGDPSINVYLVAHLGGAEPLDTLMSRSLARAELLKRQLENLGIAADRVIARGVGPLAPVCGLVDCSDRVEIVLSQ